jgi:hypothetical protein
MLETIVKNAVKEYAHKSVDELIDKAEALIKDNTQTQVIKEEVATTPIAESSKKFRNRKLICNIGITLSVAVASSALIGFCYSAYNFHIDKIHNISVPGVLLKMLLF